MTDCLIIGGGAIGMLTALELRKNNLSVKLLERGATGQEASWAGGGILSPLYPWRYEAAVTQLARWSQTHFPSFLQQLAEQTGIDPEYNCNGFLVLGQEEATQACKWATHYDYALEKVDAQQLVELEPALNPANLEAGLYFPTIGQVRNPRLVKALRQAIDNSGIEVHEYTEVQKLITQDKAMSGVETSHGRLQADHVVIAAGAWSARLLKELTLAVAVTPVRGQMIMFHSQPNFVKRIVLAHNRYIIPRLDGRVLIGSTLEKAGFNKITTQQALQDLKQIAFELMPGLNKFPVEKHWAGLRPSSPNNVPYIGEHPELKGLYLNTGHFRNGIVMSLASARLVSDLILQREPILDPHPYALDSQRSASEASF